MVPRRAPVGRKGSTTAQYGLQTVSELSRRFYTLLSANHVAPKWSYKVNLNPSWGSTFLEEEKKERVVKQSRGVIDTLAPVLSGDRWEIFFPPFGTGQLPADRINSSPLLCGGPA